jgi:hypothetical protein
VRNNMIITYAALCAMGAITTGCSSIGITKEETKEVPKVASVQNVTNVPEWFFDKEAEDSKSITVTATDVSKDMQWAIDKATMNAKIQIASRLKSDINSLSRETTVESGSAIKDVEREIDRASKVKVNQAIGFFKREQLAVVRDGDGYRAFVKLKISVEDARRLTVKKDTASREDKFKELDKEVSVDVIPTR